MHVRRKGAYDEKAVGTQLNGALRRPGSERTLANKERAISYAAYRALTDVLPVNTESVYKPLMKQLGYDPNDNSTDIESPTGIGNVACAAVLEYRHHDESTQLGVHARFLGNCEVLGWFVIDDPFCESPIAEAEAFTEDSLTCSVNQAS